MTIVKTVYVNKLPPKNAIVHLLDAISSCSPEEIKRPNPTPDLHYFEMYWYTPSFGGVQKNVLRLLFPTYKEAVKQHGIMFEKLFGNTENWEDGYYAEGLKEIKKEIKISKENRLILERWKAKYERDKK